ncbi:MAG: hypothetical protein CL607_12595 [Anaerolineaceae bacterium]|nr:hypothetical protein [Anaerolineaceae bacterium]|tara:strand:- start:531 stop:794 length:264 start_codon:yes stop_codon:yes gene_type:complete
MAKIWIPALLQDLTEGHQHLDVPGETVRDVIMLLEEKYPGIAHRLIEDGKIRPGMSVVVDNTVSPLGLRHKLTESSEVHFLPALSGG